MQGITSFCDEASCFLIDPLNTKYSTNTQYIACAITILLGVATLGMAQVASLIWRNVRQIEENETLGIITNLFITAMDAFLESDAQYDEGSPQTPHPEQFYKDTSIYNLIKLLVWNSLSIKVVRRGLKEVPDFHLHQLAQSIEEGIKGNGMPTLDVEFLNDNLKPLVGIDSGGLSRDYLDDLFEGIVQSSKFSFVNLENSSLVLPQTKEEAQAFESLPELNDEEQTLYQEMGKVMMFCYRSELRDESHYLIGRRFADALFKAALCLRGEEIDTTFDSLSMQTKLKMCEALLNGLSNSGMDLTYLKKRCDWLADFDQLDSDQLLEAAVSVHYSELLPDDFTIDHLGEEPDLEQIKRNLDKFKECLSASIFCQKGGHGQFGAQLAPIHAIAKGMKSICNPCAYPLCEDNDCWNSDFHPLHNYEDFSSTVQGVLDRDQIVALFQIDNWLQGKEQQEIEKKMGWLKEWIKDTEDGATEDELKRLLKFMLGSTGFQKNVQVKVDAQILTPYCPVPVMNTCFFRMLLAPKKSQYGSLNDHTKENFIESLKELALRNPSNYHTA